ncbi:MmpS family transport accessory protein [Lentzea flaviverrucosa]|uniref:Membrane protein n=1 Tax=Lentzea flaviverrucosa TaxID=200379 RepID=A0A1H9KMC9_9PSEU|nr:MmpS family transport accessory protein [Lentzea flaviverrucosa]RDI17921.1 MmpS family membrane protein [Lentzea flaviverrucosa]SER00248.1 membrane protein [Lentzea flaviverrucosa]
MSHLPPHLPPEYGVAPPLHDEVRRTRKGPWIFLLVIALLAVGGVMYGPRAVDAVRDAVQQAEPEPGPLSVVPESSPAPAKRTVVFEVTGTGKAFNVTATVGASIHNEAGVTLPWTRTVEVPAGRASESVMLVVVAGSDGAEVHGKYTIDGATVREGKASGPYGVLTITDS